jgi:hypothetical protein
MEGRGGTAGVGFWGFGSMLAITLLERQPLHFMDDPSRHSELALRNLLCN